MSYFCCLLYFILILILYVLSTFVYRCIVGCRLSFIIEPVLCISAIITIILFIIMVFDQIYPSIFYC